MYFALEIEEKTENVLNTFLFTNIWCQIKVEEYVINTLVLGSSLKEYIVTSII